MITVEEATTIFDLALTEAIKECDAIPKAIQRIQEGGWIVDDIETIIHLHAPEPPVAAAAPLVDADFLRDMHIVPDIAPSRRKRFHRWPTKRRTLVLPLAALLSLSTLTGCANLHISCQPGAVAPIITNPPAHPIARHPVCGLHR